MTVHRSFAVALAAAVAATATAARVDESRTLGGDLILEFPYVPLTELALSLEQRVDA